MAPTKTNIAQPLPVCRSPRRPRRSPPADGTPRAPAPPATTTRRSAPSSPPPRRPSCPPATPCARSSPRRRGRDRAGRGGRQGHLRPHRPLTGHSGSATPSAGRRPGAAGLRAGQQRPSDRNVIRTESLAPFGLGSDIWGENSTSATTRNGGQRARLRAHLGRDRRRQGRRPRPGGGRGRGPAQGGGGRGGAAPGGLRHLERAAPAAAGRPTPAGGPTP